MADPNRVIRQSQAAISYGVGSIYDVLGESFVLCDIGQWASSEHRARGREIYAERLIQSLSSQGYHVDRLHEPVEMEEAKPSFDKPPTRGLPYFRFPRWLFCSECRRMILWKRKHERQKSGDQPGCLTCGSRYKLTPMRFIVICEDGHMGDVPWGRWAHSQSDSQQQCSNWTENLEFVSRSGFGGGLASLAVRCRECRSVRSLEGITVENALKRQIGWNCPSQQPWEFGGERDCDRDIYVVQKGSGSVYYPSRASAITIPPESNREVGEADLAERVRDDDRYEYIDDEETLNALVPQMAEDLGASEKEVRRIIADDDEEEDDQDDKSILTQEWEALTEPHNPSDPRAEFVNEELSLIPKEDLDPSAPLSALDDVIGRVMAVRKLREVRALVGFHRYKPGGSDHDERLVEPDLGRGENWLPATEVYGEGIFLTLNEDKLGGWEERDEVKRRARIIEWRREGSTYESITHEASPRYVLLHTLSHLLIRQLAFSCGYASASLKERIYADEQDGKAGILVYTADGDSEGTLGGLVRQAEPPRLASNVIAALYKARGCSSDPVCFESEGQGVEGMNLAACHACTLAPETSCESTNLLLDRVMLLGNGEVEGFFAPLMEEALTEAI